MARLGRTAEQGALPEPRCARTPAAEHVLHEQENASRGHADRLEGHRAGPPRGDRETQGGRQGSPLRGSAGGFGAEHRRLLKTESRAREDDEGRRRARGTDSATGRSWIVASARTIRRTISDRPSRRSFRKPSRSGASSSSMRVSPRRSSTPTWPHPRPSR